MICKLNQQFFSFGSLYMAYSVAMYLIYVNNDPSNACQLVFWITVIWPVTNYMVPIRF